MALALCNNWGRHNYIGRSYTGRNYIGHSYIGHDHICHNYIGHNCVGHNYTCHNYMCHNYIAMKNDGRRQRQCRESVLTNAVPLLTGVRIASPACVRPPAAAAWPPRSRPSAAVCLHHNKEGAKCRLPCMRRVHARMHAICARIPAPCGIQHGTSALVVPIRAAGTRRKERCDARLLARGARQHQSCRAMRAISFVHPRSVVQQAINNRSVSSVRRLH